MQYTEPADNRAMNALLKEVVKLRDELGQRDFGSLNAPSGGGEAWAMSWLSR
ncbi:hypothetical protein ACIRD9_41245 [Streptomyces violaceus]|uniref:hypothetical protein n=1 Tax=Streptomyces violaceus TaxID=1936 RepID=UPI0037FCCD65